MTGIVKGISQREGEIRMKKITAGMFASLAAIAVAAPFFALAVLVGARAVEIATDAQDDFLLAALAVAAAAVGAINALGRGEQKSPRGRLASEGRSRVRGATTLHLGY